MIFPSMMRARSCGPLDLIYSGLAAVSFFKLSPSNLTGSPSTATCLSRDVTPDSTRTSALRHAERLGKQFGDRAVGLAAFGDGANPDLDHGAAIGERFNTVDIVAAAAWRHPQRHADALVWSTARDPFPRVHRRAGSEDAGVDVIGDDALDKHDDQDQDRSGEISRPPRFGIIRRIGASTGSVTRNRNSATAATN